MLRSALRKSFLGTGAPGMLKQSMRSPGLPRRPAMFPLCCVVILLVAGMSAPPACARRQETGFLNRVAVYRNTVYRYVVYLPSAWSPKQKWPVILFLHGSGERGTDGMDETQIGLPGALRSHPDRWPFVVVMPQLPYDHHHWTDPDMMDMAMSALNAEIKEFHGDSQRLYLTGISLGGYGVWEIAKDYPGRFAAIVPVSGGIFWSYAPERWHEPDLAGEYVKAIGRTPVWIFHGADDPVVSPAQAQILYKALSSGGGDVRFWEYADYHHNAWDKAYSDPQLPQWLLARRQSDIATRRPYAEKRLIPLHPIPVVVDPALLVAYEGEYVDAGVTQMTIFRQGDKLMSKNRTGGQSELLAETSDRFFYPSGSSIRITFERDSFGLVTGILFHDDRHEEHWKKMR